MFEFIGGFVVKSIEKLLGVAIDIGKESILNRRTLFKKVLRLYESLIVLEKESKEVLREFIGYINGTETLTRTIPGRKLAKLENALEEYEASINQLEIIVGIYDASLLVVLKDLSSFKGPHLRRVSLMVPRAGRGDYEILVQTKRPSPKQVPVSSEEVPLLSEKINIGLFYKPEVIDELGIRSVDLRDKNELGSILRDSEFVISEIARAKSSLGEFIRKNFPIDKIIER